MRRKHDQSFLQKNDYICVEQKQSHLCCESLIHWQTCKLVSADFKYVFRKMWWKLAAASAVFAEFLVT